MRAKRGLSQQWPQGHRLRSIIELGDQIQWGVFDVESFEEFPGSPCVVTALSVAFASVLSIERQERDHRSKLSIRALGLGFRWSLWGMCQPAAKNIWIGNEQSATFAPGRRKE